MLWACTLDLDTEEDFNRLFNCGLMGVLHGLCGIMDIARGAKWLTTRYGDSMTLTLMLLRDTFAARSPGCSLRCMFCRVPIWFDTAYIADHINRLLWQSIPASVSSSCPFANSLRACGPHLVPWQARGRA